MEIDVVLKGPLQVSHRVINGLSIRSLASIEFQAALHGAWRVEGLGVCARWRQSSIPMADTQPCRPHNDPNLVAESVTISNLGPL